MSLRSIRVGFSGEGNKEWVERAVTGFGATFCAGGKASPASKLTHLISQYNTSKAKTARGRGAAVVTLQWVKECLATRHLTLEKIDEITQKHLLVPVEKKENFQIKEPVNTYPAPPMLTEQDSAQEAAVSPTSMPSSSTTASVSLPRPISSPTMDTGLSNLEHCPPFAVFALLRGGSLAHVVQLVAPATPTAPKQFSSPFHMLRCLSKYGVILTLKHERLYKTAYPIEHVRSYAAFIDVVLEKLEKRIPFNTVSKFVAEVLTASIADIRFGFTNLDVSMFNGMDAELEGRKEKNGIPTVSEICSTVIFRAKKPSQLSMILMRPDFTELLGMSCKDSVIKAAVSAVFNMCIKLNLAVWTNVEFWELLNLIANQTGTENFKDALVSGLNESGGILSTLGRIPCPASDKIDIETIHATLYALVKERLHRINQITESGQLPPLLEALRSGASPIVSFLISKLHMQMSRQIPMQEAECAWALLATAKTGTWDMLSQLLSNGDMSRIFDRDTDENVANYLDCVEHAAPMSSVQGEMKSAAHWSLQTLSLSLLSASFGNMAVFSQLLDSLCVSDILRLKCRVKVQWRPEDEMAVLEVGPLEMAMLGGFITEASMLLEVLNESSASNVLSSLNTNIFIEWTKWVMQNFPEPVLPSVHSKIDQLSSAAPKTDSVPPITLIFQILTFSHYLQNLLGNALWTASLPQDLYAREWISDEVLLEFMDEPRFTPAPKDSQSTHILCWAAWRFDYSVLHAYMTNFCDDLDFGTITTVHGETWLHLLARGFLANGKAGRKSRALGLVRLGLQSGGGAVCRHVDAAGWTALDVWKNGLDSLFEVDVRVAEVKNIINVIERNVARVLEDVAPKLEEKDAELVKKVAAQSDAMEVDSDAPQADLTKSETSLELRSPSVALSVNTTVNVKTETADAGVLMDKLCSPSSPFSDVAMVTLVLPGALDLPRYKNAIQPVHHAIEAEAGAQFEDACPQALSEGGHTQIAIWAGVAVAAEVEVAIGTEDGAAAAAVAVAWGEISKVKQVGDVRRRASRSPVTRQGSDQRPRDPVTRSSSHSLQTSETKKQSNESQKAPEGKTPSQASPPNESRKAAEEKQRETPSQLSQSSNQRIKPVNVPASKPAIAIVDEPLGKSAEPPKTSASQSAPLPNPPPAPMLLPKNADESKNSVEDSKDSEVNSTKSNGAVSTKDNMNIESESSKVPNKALNESPSSNDAPALPSAPAAAAAESISVVDLVDDAPSPTAVSIPLPSRPTPSALPAKREANSPSSSSQRSASNSQKSQSKKEFPVPANTHKLPPVPPKSANQPASAASSSKAEGQQVHDLREKLLNTLKRKAEEEADTTEKQSKMDVKVVEKNVATDTPKKSQKFSASSSANASLNNADVSNTASTSSVPSPNPITFRLGGAVAPPPYKLPPPPPPVKAPSDEPTTRVPISLRLGGKMDSRADGEDRDFPRSTGPKNSWSSRPKYSATPRYAPVMENSQPRYFTQSFSQPGAYMSTYDPSRQGVLAPFRLPYPDERGSHDERGSRGSPADRSSDSRHSGANYGHKRN
ncbi:hypothetical protein HDU80_000673 [Chytriomyces hyalinus]|nr:hypothetical protein HDU80_000673 [Chytriomyces hyalinus]